VISLASSWDETAEYELSMGDEPDTQITIRSAVILVVFAYFGTRAVASYGFGRPRARDAD
jgi:hypothetical protein